ncbi:MAG: oligosaccharide flippase family protein [Thermomicrobiales bacterium]
MAVTLDDQPSAPLVESAPHPAGGARALLANSLTMFGGQLAIKALSFIFSIAVIRHLGDEQYGQYAICVAFGGLFTVLSDLGLAQLTVKRIAQRPAPGVMARTVANVVALRVCLALAVVALTTIIAWLVGYSPRVRVGIFIAVLGLLSYAFFGVADAVAMGLERFRFSAVLNVCLQLTTMGLAALLVFGGGGFLGLLTATTIGVFAVGLLALRRLNRDVSLRAPLAPASWPGLVRGALPFAAITLALSVSYKADAVILSFAVSTALVGAYTVAYNLVFTCSTISHSINLALFPAMTREHARAPEAAQRLFQHGFRYLLLLSLPIAIFVSLNAHAIVLLLYGERFAAAALPMALLAWVVPLMFLSEFLGYVAIVVDRETLAARANWVSSAANVAANLAFIPFFGIAAAAAVTVGTELALVGQYLIALRRHRLFASTRRALLGTLLAGAVLAIVLLLLRPVHWPVLALGPIAGLVYLVAAFATGALGRAELELVAALVAPRLQRIAPWIPSPRRGL